jgi:hypothetical protein
MKIYFCGVPIWMKLLGIIRWWSIRLIERGIYENMKKIVPMPYNVCVCVCFENKIIIIIVIIIISYPKTSYYSFTSSSIHNCVSMEQIDRYLWCTVRARLCAVHKRENQHELTFNNNKKIWIEIIIIIYFSYFFLPFSHSLL